jgi:hypothetical protein
LKYRTPEETSEFFCGVNLYAAPPELFKSFIITFYKYIAPPELPNVQSRRDDIFIVEKQVRNELRRSGI